MTLKERIQQCEEYKATCALMDTGSIETEIKGQDIILKRCDVQGEFIVPEFINVIGERAFEWKEGITKIIIGDNIIEIGNNVFSDCSSLKIVSIPSRFQCVIERIDVPTTCEIIYN